MMVNLMKPKDLNYPFSFENRQLLTRDFVFYLPPYLDCYSGFDAQLPLGSKPVFVEFCSGNGEWIIDKALKNPEIQFIAVEKMFLRVKKIFSKRENLEIKNLFIVCGDINLLLEHFLPKECVDTLAINFPDPWPKERHIKHRLFHKNFVEKVEGVLKEGGDLFLVTDDNGFSEWVKNAMNSSILSSHKPDLLEPIDSYGSSFFLRLWESKGKEIFYHHYKKGVYAGR
ncbi:MAG: tRNA (guanosine(46)-N7)-methyltransferase TrmB [Verrucomicrobia bacterium]|nr:tRNA (guanosine(46)-N7)-methyltransferase TrmB [Verrucomicrobiota bacterium]